MPGPALNSPSRSADRDRIFKAVPPAPLGGPHHKAHAAPGGAGPLPEKSSRRRSSHPAAGVGQWRHSSLLFDETAEGAGVGKAQRF